VAKDASINHSDVESFQIRLPDLALQNQFQAIAGRHERLRAIRFEAIRQANHLFQTLLRQAFSNQ
jgi:type I restriction enzyme S subunit